MDVRANFTKSMHVNTGHEIENGGNNQLIYKHS